MKPTLFFLNSQYMENYSNYNNANGGSPVNNRGSERSHIVKTRVRKVGHFCDILRSENVYYQLLNMKLIFCKKCDILPKPINTDKILDDLEFKQWNLNFATLWDTKN